MENGTPLGEVTCKYQITPQFLSKIRKEIQNDEWKLEVDKLPLDLKQKIASETNASVDILQIAQKYNLNPEIVRIIFKKMKGGANW